MLRDFQYSEAEARGDGLVTRRCSPDLLKHLLLRLFIRPAPIFMKKTVVIRRGLRKLRHPISKTSGFSWLSQSWDELALRKKDCPKLPRASSSNYQHGRHLAKAEKTPEYWNYIADGGFSVFADTEDVAVMEFAILIVRLHQSVKFSGAPSYLPVEIWNMKELRHLQFMGSDLPDQWRCPTKSFNTFGRQFLIAAQGIEPFRPFNHLVQLKKLKSLKCVVVNPRFESQVIALSGPKSNYHLRFKKLTLSVCGFRWEDLNNISALAYLEVLKLRCHAFQGPMWDVKDVLCGLKFLLLEDMDLVHWRSYVSSFMQLRHLSIGHCYKLEEFPDCLGKIFSVELIELLTVTL
ncbi:hypothetical protein BUALT_Bualt17G0078300 [Buddleja alternifolia]|uniref:Uncharacterized protein n=1 Tax=Buddleja alternifolia TaxID=168488 RepID=A0AAV6WCD4_9LAMI|nr:hypothetical protein BUALT_Bualt17G0078300 [Buddleja alternifolia]